MTHLSPFARCFFLACGVAFAGCSAGAGNLFVTNGDGGDPSANDSDADPSNDPGADGGKLKADARSDARSDGHVADAGTDDLDADDPPDTNPPQPTGPTKTGRITVGQTITIINGNHYDSSYASAMFMETPVPSGSSSCTYSKHGACEVYDCPLPSTVDAGTIRYAGAGTVDITGGFTSYSMQTSAGSYTSVSSQQLLFQSGTTLHVSATGDEVPAFSNHSITVPSVAFELQSPSLASTLTLARSQALALAWTGAAGRTVTAQLSTTQQNVRSVAITCTFSGSSGSGSVPAAAMSKLMQTSGAVDGYFSVNAPIETTFQAGAWQITFGLNDAPLGRELFTSN